MNRLKIARNIATTGFAVLVVGLMIKIMIGADFGQILMGIGALIGLASYFFGGLGVAIRMSKNIAKQGWYFVRFPYDIVTFIFAFMIALGIFVLVPIVPVRKAYKESIFM